MTSPVLEFRVALTAQDYDRLVAFYEEILGLEADEIWTAENNKGVIYDMGRGTLEILDEQSAATVDRLEVGERVSGQIRFALQVEDVDAVVAKAVSKGAKLVHDPIITPWRHKNARLQSPDGLQITLFEVIK